ncbi:hypothetical protein DSCA_23500 [Desulfosarcina alkanivorans]|uniref:Uncharacterized protein n=1 Tax=Desulfosarcina alkanivorans TaxID=571177 RepID=A0A5K7YJU1_9BACT|nr:hypothetical protein [Desulfosarcina alkanivorans]BBO68420.1 hypothetical protein DSCA_23500 [Desulfosarcina alkanivorans]
MTLFTVSVCACWTLPPARAGEAYHYRETTGKAVTNGRGDSPGGSLLTLACTSLNEQHTTTTRHDYDTVRWRVSAGKGRTAFLAERDKNTIVIHGMLSGQPVDKVLKVDNATWYRAASLSLRELVASDDSERVFWTIRYDTLTAHKIRTIKT